MSFTEDTEASKKSSEGKDLVYHYSYIATDNFQSKLAQIESRFSRNIKEKRLVQYSIDILKEMERRRLKISGIISNAGQLAHERARK